MRTLERQNGFDVFGNTFELSCESFTIGELLELSGWKWPGDRVCLPLAMDK